MLQYSWRALAGLSPSALSEGVRKLQELHRRDFEGGSRAEGGGGGGRGTQRGFGQKIRAAVYWQHQTCSEASISRLDQATHHGRGP